MLSSIRGLWQVRRGRNAAVSVIAPLVASSRYRLQGLPGGIWLDPYMVGFIMMLITLTARRAGHVTDSEALADVQSQAWAEITQLAGSLISEETFHLSVTGHDAFAKGCKNAVAFDLALYQAQASSAGLSIPGYLDRAGHAGPEVAQSIMEDETILALWRNYFEGHLGGQQ
jgi:hypothetical protein